MKAYRVLGIIVIILSLLAIVTLFFSLNDKRKNDGTVNPDFNGEVEIGDDNIVIKPNEIGDIKIGQIIKNFNNKMKLVENNLDKEDGVIHVNADKMRDYKIIIDGKTYQVDFDFINMVFVYDGDMFIAGYKKTDEIIRNYPRVLYRDKEYKEVADLKNIVDQRLYIMNKSNDFLITYIVDNNVHEVFGVSGGSQYEKLVPEKEGHTVIGWIDSEGNVFDFNTEITSNLVLIAGYEANSYNIEVFEIDSKGDQVLVSNKEYKYGEKLNLSFVDKDDWNIFGGVYLEYDKDNNQYSDPLNVKNQLEVKQNQKLYVKYTYFPHVQYYDGDNLILREYYESGLIVIPNITKSGYKVEGWYLEKELSTKYDFAQQPTTNMKLYAKWNSIEFDIEYELNGGLNHANNPNKYDLNTDDITLHPASKEGHDFVGWYLNEEKVEVIKKGTKNNLLLVAKYKVKTFDIIIKDQDGNEVIYNDVKYGDKLEKPTPDPTKNGYTFDGWVDQNGDLFDFDNDTIKAGLELKPKFTIIEYTITYELDGGENNSNNPIKYTVETETIELLAAVREGYDFKGWLNGTVEILRIEKGRTGNIVLSAKFDRTEIIITIENPDGTTTEVTLDYGDKLEKPTPDPTKDGYTFEGWLDKDGNPFDFDSPVTTNDIKVIPKFVPIEYNIVYVLDGSDNDEDNPLSYTIEDGIITLKPASKEGYRFEGWFDESNEKITTIDSSKLMNRTLTTKFVEQIKLTFMNEEEVVHEMLIDINSALTEKQKELIEEKYLPYIGESKELVAFETQTAQVSLEHEFNQSMTIKPIFKSRHIAPQMLSVMTKVYYEGYNDVLGDSPNFEEEKWYDYDSSKWANTKSKDGSYWVWIPRFSYLLEQRTTTGNAGGKVHIRFSEKTADGFKDYTTGGYQVHPAFRFKSKDESKEYENISGFWIAKFQISGGTLSKPGYTVQILTDLSKAISNVSEQRNGINWEGTNYDITITNLFHYDAVVFLTQSIYGRNGQRMEKAPTSSPSMTGDGGTNFRGNLLRTTTGNSFGVYDMANAAREVQITRAHDNGSGTQFIQNKTAIENSYMNRYYDLITDYPEYVQTIEFYTGWFGTTVSPIDNNKPFYINHEHFSIDYSNGVGQNPYTHRVAIIEK